jgi:putative hydrolases of HD superfamily
MENIHSQDWNGKILPVPPTGISERLRQQIAFILEADKLKAVLRRSYLTSADRRENSGEHSWHISLAALVLTEYSNAKIDLNRVLKMLVVHDLVEIDAGDTFVYDTIGNESKAKREQEAADRIFGLLPSDQEKEFRQLWEEFEEHSTSESKFANAIDRMMPALHNYFTDGRSWKEHGITKAQALSKNSQIADGAGDLWYLIRSLIEKAC